MGQPPPNLLVEPDAGEPGAADIALVPSSDPVPDGWRSLRDNPDIQFDEFALAPPEVREPNWFDEAWRSLADFLSGILGPVGEFLAIYWHILQWVLLGLLVLFVLYWIARSIGPLARSKSKASSKAQSAKSDPEWQPSVAESLALLEDADRLAANGQFDEATHLLLKRSVSQIATAKPEWVDPSSTARELAALPTLSEPARIAFYTISDRVERSLFALRRLDRTDWEAARSAYAEFAKISIGGTRETSA